MPARVVVVHDEPGFADEVAAALNLTGFSAVAFTDPMIALDALDAAQTVDVLVTRIAFPSGKPNGIAIARMARTKRPGIRVLFVAQPEFREYADGLGDFMPMPAAISDVTAAVIRLLDKREPESPSAK